MDYDLIVVNIYVFRLFCSNPFPLSEWITTKQHFFRCVIRQSVATLFHYQNGLRLSCYWKAWIVYSYGSNPFPLSEWITTISAVTCKFYDTWFCSNPFPLSEWITTPSHQPPSIVPHSVATLFHYQNGLRLILQNRPYRTMTGSNPFPLSEWITTVFKVFVKFRRFIVATLFHYQNGLRQFNNK